MTAPATIVWTGDEAEWRRFAEAHADEFAWGFAALDDGRLDRTALELWPHGAEPWEPQFARLGDIVTSEGDVVPAPLGRVAVAAAFQAGLATRVLCHPLTLAVMVVVGVVALALCVTAGNVPGTYFASGAVLFGLWALDWCIRHDEAVRGTP